MGTYCYNECGQKLMSFIVPASCECGRERFCVSCWNNVMFAPRYVKVSEDLYTIDKSHEGPKCKDCGTAFVQEECDDDDG